jgi:hypothetical protein
VKICIFLEYFTKIHKTDIHIVIFKIETYFINVVQQFDCSYKLYLSLLNVYL